MMEEKEILLTQDGYDKLEKASNEFVLPHKFQYGICTPYPKN